jgi:hypothetical protein
MYILVSSFQKKQNGLFSSAQTMLFAIFLINIAFAVAATVDVTTKLGDIRGFEYQTEGDFEAQVFLGIPYAQKPIGELRFKVLDHIY